MARHLLISVRFHDGRYHGAGDNPPSPARLFQALVAGTGLGGPQALKDATEVLQWLERLAPPVVASPLMTRGQRVKNFVPNNDLDSVGGHPRRIAEIRTDKAIHPWLFDSEVPFLYAWELSEAGDDERNACRLCEISEDLYQFGRGVDPAWAQGELVDGADLKDRLLGYRGQIYRPARANKGTDLACPTRGSLASLVARHTAGTKRFSASADGKRLFVQQPTPYFVDVAYESPPARYLFELRMAEKQGAFARWPLSDASRLVTLLRDGAVERLRDALPDELTDIERFMIGRKADGSDDAPTNARVMILPLPSIGHDHADHGIRRVLVEVPTRCPLRPDDVCWAFSGLELVDETTGEVSDWALALAHDDAMLAHYGVRHGGCGYRIWRSITPVALPISAKRRRVEPRRVSQEPKPGSERAVEQTRASHALRQAMRHVEIEAQVESARLQREPFDRRGARVEVFGPGTRFDKHRLWHVEIAFDKPVRGPLSLGDGRFLGLGVLAPRRQRSGIFAFVVEDGLAPSPQPLEVARALRRAVMARVQALLPRAAHLPTYFCGHEADGSPTREKEHVAYTFDPERALLLVLAPHVISHRQPYRAESSSLEQLERALRGFSVLRAGSAGLLRLREISIDPEHDPLFAPSRSWRSLTPYTVTRHKKGVGAARALALDLATECRRRGLPDAHVSSDDVRGVSHEGLVGYVQLDFARAVAGPIVLGRSRYVGGGVFVSETDGPK